MRIHPSEIAYSKIFHQQGTPLLLCPFTLRKFHFPQIDLSRVDDSTIQLVEIKSSQQGRNMWMKKLGQKYSPMKRLQHFLQMNLKCQKINLSCLVIGAKK